jgi:hypothetical protein
MFRRIARAFGCAAACTILAPGAHAAAGPLLVNEVFYDPPGPDAGLEFIEIINAGDDPLDLGSARIETGDGAGPDRWTVAWTGVAGVVLEPGALWCVGEADVLPGPDAVADLDLQNGPDACRVIVAGAVSDLVGWGAHTHAGYFLGTPAPDVSGVSLARIPDGADSGDNARDLVPADAPTPGAPNALDVDLALTPHAGALTPSLPEPFAPVLWRVTVVNRGIGASGAGALLRIAGGSSESSRAIPPMGRGESAEIEAADAVGDAGVHERRFRLDWPADQNASNDSCVVRFRVGAGPLVVNEIAYAPRGEDPEWVEVINRSPDFVDPVGWTLADSRDEPVSIPDGTPSLEPGALLLLAEGALPGAVAVIPEGKWPSLNNARQAGESFADRLRLRDAEGLLSDEVPYASEWGGGDGFTLERVNGDLPSGASGTWGTSSDPSGGTPGRANSIAVAFPRQRGRIVAEPSPFEPDAGGRVLIAVELPGGTIEAEASIFDMSGRRVRDLGSLTGGRSRLLWAGDDGSGSPAPLGLYVIVATGRSGDGTVWREQGTVVLSRLAKGGGR